jgi:hypothetical protein
MSAPVRPHPPLQMERLEEAKTIDDVLRNIDQITSWSISAPSTIGYFAALYKRATLAVRQAIEAGRFQDGALMEHFDVVFAGRYFNAVNAYFYPGEYDGLTAPWDVALVGHQDPKATMIQQMMTGLNAHICFDLGVTTAALAGNDLQKFEHDFNLINAIIAAQVPGMLDVFQQLSPEFRLIRRLVPNDIEIALINRLLKKFRTGAWLFAIYLALHPDAATEKQTNQGAWTSALGAWYLQPPATLTPFPLFIRAIAARESRDVAGNIRALDEVRMSPEKRTRRFL